LAFSGCSNLVELVLPTELIKIADEAFNGCSKITEIHIPAKVNDIGKAAFTACPLVKITVAEENTVYEVVNNCLIKGKGLATGKTIVKGLTTGTIPADGSVNKLLDYCFASTGITNIFIPDGITTIANNAFSRCSSLEDLRLPADLLILDATCFAWCSKLKNVDLPNTVQEIKTYAFHRSAIEDIVIPASVNRLLEQSFGEITSLKTVTFQKKLDANGNIIAPYINRYAFTGSGNGTVVFNVPWSEDYDYNYIEKVGNEEVKVNPTGWGAKNYIVNYNYEEA
jgi:hypothetical protein